MPRTSEQRRQRRQRQARKEGKQQRVLRAIQMVATSGFVDDNLSLQESCLTICNSCREYIPLRFLKIDRLVPSTLLALVWPDVHVAEAKGGSRVQPHKRVAMMYWRFDDPHTPDGKHYKVPIEADDNQKEKEQKEEAVEEEEDWEDGALSGEEEDDEEEDDGEEDKKEEEEEEEEEEWQEEDVEMNEKESKEVTTERDPVNACNIDMSKVRWPEGVKEIYLWGFNRRIDGIEWPDSLEVLSFHMPLPESRPMKYRYGITGNFNTSLDGATFPAGLRVMSLGREFNQPIHAVDWPEGLTRLSMPGFDQPIQDVQWPSGLKTLEFMTPYKLEVQQEAPEEQVCWDDKDGLFDHPLDSFLPMGLETLWLSNCFDQSLRDVTWPSGLAVLGLGTWISTESLDGVEWPENLRDLVVAETFLLGDDAPPNCKVTQVQQRDAPIVEDETIEIISPCIESDDSEPEELDNYMSDLGSENEAYDGW